MRSGLLRPERLAARSLLGEAPSPLSAWRQVQAEPWRSLWHGFGPRAGSAAVWRGDSTEAAAAKASAFQDGNYGGSEKAPLDAESRWKHVTEPTAGTWVPSAVPEGDAASLILPARGAAASSLVQLSGTGG